MEIWTYLLRSYLRKMNNKISTDRIEYIDIIRGIGILLMIMGHIGFEKSFDIYIHAFHMPVFYVISGYLFKTDTVETERFIVRKARQLLVPYFFFSIINFFMAYVLGGTNVIDFWKELNDTFFDPTMGQVPIAGALWFLPALFWMNIIFHFLHKWFGQNDYVLFTFTLIIGFVAMVAVDRYNIYLPMGLDAALVGVCFAGTGYFLKQMSQKKIVSFILHMNVAIFIILAVVHRYLIFENELVNFRAGNYQNVFLTWFNGMVGTILLWNLSNWLSLLMKKWKRANIIRGIAQIGAHSITFVCLNQLVIKVVTLRLAVPVLEKTSILFLREIIILLVVCFALYVIMQILENSRLKVVLGK